MLKTFSKFTSYLFFACLLLASAFGAAQAQKLSAEEVIAKHLESIGPKEKRDQIKNRFVPAALTFERKVPVIKGGGKAVFVSDNSNLFFLAKLNSHEYSQERIGYFSGKVNLPWVTAGTRSPLGAYLADHPKMLEDGLLMGTITCLWALESPKGKVQGGGRKKVDDREVYVLEYYPKNVGAEFTVKMFFDAQTFQHLRTEYRHTISQQQQSFKTMGTRGGAFYVMNEYFGEYRDESGLMLPHTYKITYVTNTDAGTDEFTWTMNIGEYHFNQNLAPNFFTFDTD
jgi:hypothetical protein